MSTAVIKKLIRSFLIIPLNIKIQRAENSMLKTQTKKIRFAILPIQMENYEFSDNRNILHF